MIEDPDVLHTVSWKDIPTPQLGDAVIVYLVPDSSQLPVPTGPDKKALGFYFAKEHDPGKLGAGSVSVPIYLPRDMAFYFEYTRITDQTSTVIAYSKLLVSMDQYVCTHFHLATTHEPNEMLIQYVTSQLDDKQHFVEISTTPFEGNPTNSMFFPANDTKLHYKRTDMFEEPATSQNFWIDPGRFRESLVIGLKPNTRYLYRVVDSNKKPISKEFFFISAPIPGADDTKTDLYIFGDLGVAFPFYTTVQQQPPSEKTTTSIFKQLTEKHNRGDFSHSSLLLIGDISYARGYHWMWEYFFKQIEPIASQMPFHVSIGNHEYDYLKQKWKPGMLCLQFYLI